MKGTILLTAIFCFSLLNAQILGDDYLESESLQLDLQAKNAVIQPELNLSEMEIFLPLEHPVDPAVYILGPGDVLSVNILSIENISIPIRINPTGDLVIPSVGIVNITGLTINLARDRIVSFFKENGPQNAVIDITLSGIRTFKVLITGAVQNPGFTQITAVERLYDAILRAGGMQKFAHPDIIQLKRDGENSDLFLKNFLTSGELNQNPHLREGDVIHVPYNQFAVQKGYTNENYNRHQVIVTGFVGQINSTRAFNYFPGYTANDYLSLVGGPKENRIGFWTGNKSKTIINRADGTIIKRALNEIVLPGDVIEVPPSIAYRVLGGESIIRAITAIASVYLAYEAARK